MADTLQPAGAITNGHTEVPAVIKPAAAWRPQFNPWLIAVIVALAAFMEVLDTSIANVALPYMAGNLGVSNDESTWVLTSYLVSNAIVLPISGWLVTVVGRKRLFMICLLIFTVSSLLCGIAPSLGALILFRVLQGAGGGGLQPLAQSILADSFPPEKRGIAFAVYGITVIVAPTVGPTLGGWITDSYSWRWIFFINLPVGILALLLVFQFVDDPPWAHRVKDALARVDYVGIALLTVGVGALQVMLDKGQEDDWFGSNFIVTLTVIATVCLTALVFCEWRSREPIVDVRLFKNGNFAAANMMMFMVGAISFASTVLMPQFLQTLMGYTAQKAGMVMSAAALVLLLELPLVGQLTTHFQSRHLIAFGWLALTVTMYLSTKRIDLEMSFQSATWLRILQYFPLGFIFIPASTAAYNGIPGEKNNAVAALVNFTRNIGSSVGTSVVTTMLARRSQLHQDRLVERANRINPGFQAAINGLAQQLAHGGMNWVDAEKHAMARFYADLRAQATALAYLDTYLALAVAAALMFLLSFTLRKNDPRAAGKVVAH